jgi:isopentenyl-diphosphate delta-isomerase
MTDADVGRRKAEHLRLAADLEQQPDGAGWADVHLVHDALPAVDSADIDLSTELLGHRLRLPLVIAGMTGGHADARLVNERLAAVAAARGLAIGVGSQRAALRDPSVRETYTVVREFAPDALVFANIGISQLVDQDGETALDGPALRSLVTMIGADALIIHLNYLEESVQPEGQTRAAGVLDALARAVAEAGVPVVAKETGSGISRAVAERVRAIGVAAVDVGGHGGTSFAAIEAARAHEAGDQTRARLGDTFAGWGLPTPVCVAGCAGILPVIATGGVRTGLDAAAALALGATAVGVARPLLQAALAGPANAGDWVGTFERELRTAVFLTGGRTVADLPQAPRVITGSLAAWLHQLHYTTNPAQR